VETTSRSWRTAFEFGTTVLTIATCVLVVVKLYTPGGDRGTAIPLPTEPIELPATTVLGSANAAIAVAEFSDFECPYCGRFARETFPEVKRRFVDTGRIRFAFIDYPLSNHARSLQASQAADCAGQLFWTMHDSLFADQRDLTEESFKVRAKGMGLNATTFSGCLLGDPSERLKRRVALGKQLLVTGTPTFLVGTIQPDGKLKTTARLVGMQSIDQIAKALQPALDGR
jgi:protein-disulfide isomerase